MARIPSVVAVGVLSRTSLSTPFLMALDFETVLPCIAAVMPAGKDSSYLGHTVVGSDVGMLVRFPLAVKRSPPRPV